MKAYKCRFNPENQRIELMEFEIDSVYDFSHDPHSNLIGEDGSHRLEDGFQHISSFVKRTNNEIKDKKTIVFQCKDCGMFKIMEESEIKWYQDRNFALPKRCSRCRNKRRNKNK